MGDRSPGMRTPWILLILVLSASSMAPVAAGQCTIGASILVDVCAHGRSSTDDGSQHEDDATPLSASLFDVQDGNIVLAAVGIGAQQIHNDGSGSANDRREVAAGETIQELTFVGLFAPADAYHTSWARQYHLREVSAAGTTDTLFTQAHAAILAGGTWSTIDDTQTNVNGICRDLLFVHSPAADHNVGPRGCQPAFPDLTSAGWTILTLA